MATSQGVPVLDFDDRSLPEAARFELFHDTVAPLFDTSPVGDPLAFQSHATDYQLDDLLISRLRHRPQALRRTRHHLATGGIDAVAVLLHLQGSLRGFVGDRPVVNDTDHVGIIDLRQPFSAVTTDVDVIWTVVPWARLGQDRAIDVSTRLHVRSPRGRVLASTLLDLWSRLPATQQRQAPALADQLVDSISSVLDAGDFRPTDVGLELAVRRHIAANLDDLALDVSSLTATFRCSRATLYRLFKKEGGLATYIRGQRLNRCLDELLQPSAGRRPVGEIATRWGFESPSHFHRLFTARFDAPPSSVRSRSRIPPRRDYDPEVHGKIVTFHDWAEFG